MPVIVNAKERHPFLPSLGDPAAISAEQAQHQDIRPLEIAILNLMADKRTTERQLAQWLGHTPLQVRLTFIAPDKYVHDVRGGYMPKSTPAGHIRKFYNSWSDVKSRKFDGLIVTGVNALKPIASEEDIWPELQPILDWSNTNVLSSLFLCWGAVAALKHFHGIDSYNGAQKTIGVFDHHVLSDKTGLTFGLPDVFPVPVARWQRLRDEDLRHCEALETVSTSSEGGAHLMVESGAYDKGRSLFPRRVYMLNHPEYDADTLKIEYDRDNVGREVPLPVPKNYFPSDNPALAPINRWRHTAMVYANWIQAVYKATPYHIDAIPAPSRPPANRRSIARQTLTKKP